MKITVAALLLAAATPSQAIDRGRPGQGVMAARQASARPSAMAARRASAPFIAGARSLPSAPAYAAVPAAPVLRADEPVTGESGPRLTPPTGTPTPAFDRRRTLGYAAATPIEPRKEAPLGFIGADAAFQPKPPAGVSSEPPPAAPQVKVTELRVGSTTRQFGGAVDPVIFLTGAAPSGD